MLTPKEAYLKFLEFKKDSPAESIGEWYDGKSYIISNAKDGDYVDDDYLIDKNTGKIRELGFDEYIKTIQKLPEEELDNPKYRFWKVSELNANSSL